MFVWGENAECLQWCCQVWIVIGSSFSHFFFCKERHAVGQREKVEQYFPSLQNHQDASCGFPLLWTHCVCVVTFACCLWFPLLFKICEISSVNSPCVYTVKWQNCYTGPSLHLLHWKGTQLIIKETFTNAYMFYGIKEIWIYRNDSKRL